MSRASLDGPIHRAALDAIRAERTPQNLLANFCADQLASQGVAISPERYEELRRVFSAPLSEITEIDLPWDDIDESKVKLELDPEAIMRFATADLEVKYEQFFQKIIASAAKTTYPLVRTESVQRLRWHRRNIELLAADRNCVWSDSIDALEALVCASEDFIGGASARLVKWRRGHERVRQLTLLQLHARACQIAREVSALLTAGFSDGALARWRSLHEVVVVCEFLISVDAVVSQKYVDHAEVARLRAMDEIARRHPTKKSRFGVTKRTLDQQRKIVDSLRKKWGSKFSEENGWAGATLGKERPSFRDIEEYATTSYGRIQYKLASQQVHAHAFSFHARTSTLGVCPEISLSGPSNVGIEEAGRLAALSIAHLTALVVTRPGADLDALVMAKCLTKFGRDVAGVFANIGAELSG